MIKLIWTVFFLVMTCVFVSCVLTDDASDRVPKIEDPTVVNAIYMARRNYDPDGFNDALLMGELRVKNECLFVGESLVIWPRQYTLDENDDVPAVLDENRKVVFRVGEKAYVGGSSARSSNLSWILKHLVEPIPEQCDAQEIWDMSEPLPVEYRDNVDS